MFVWYKWFYRFTSRSSLSLIHIYVYKRQPLFWPFALPALITALYASKAAASTALSASLKILFAGLSVLYSVSYTHLDVYKRQALFSSNFANDANTLPSILLRSPFILIEKLPYTEMCIRDRYSKTLAFSDTYYE